MKRILIIILIACCTCSSCSWFGDKEEETAQELVDKGTQAFQKKNYRNAIASFEKLKDWYPFSKHAVLAELKIADSHYHLEEYEEAVFAYEEFESLHPRHEKIPYVLYQIGRCYFDQMDTIDRDQGTVKKALDTFTDLKEKFPGDIFADKAEEHIKKCLKSLAGNELYVGIFYYKARHYKAALVRFNTIINEYEDIGFHSEAFRYISLCEKEIAKEEAAATEAPL